MNITEPDGTCGTQRSLHSAEPLQTRTSESWVSGTEHQHQRIPEGLVPAGRGTKEPQTTRGWDSFWFGPAPPSPSWTQWREPGTQWTLHTEGPLAHPKPRNRRTQEVDRSSRLLDTCPARGELACRECSDHYDSGESWTPRTSDRG